MRIFSPPTPVEIALEQVDAWLESPSVRMLAEPTAYWDQLRPMLASARIRGPRMDDARVAALCTAHGVRELWTADRDFSAFPGLRTRNPLVA